MADDRVFAEQVIDIMHDLSWRGIVFADRDLWPSQDAKTYLFRPTAAYDEIMEAAMHVGLPIHSKD